MRQGLEGLNKGCHTFHKWRFLCRRFVYACCEDEAFMFIIFICVPARNIPLSVSHHEVSRSHVQREGKYQTLIESAPYNRYFPSRVIFIYLSESTYPITPPGQNQRLFTFFSCLKNAIAEENASLIWKQDRFVTGLEKQFWTRYMNQVLR